MRRPLLLSCVLAGLLCITVALGCVIWISDIDLLTDRANSDAERKSSEIYIDRREFADGGLALASDFTGPIRAPASLEDLREALAARHRALPTLQAELQKLQRSPDKQLADERELHYSVGRLLLYEGRLEEASAEFEKVLATGRLSGLSRERQQNLIAIQGIIALRRGEVENCIECLGPSSCIFPIAREAVHEHQAGSREAIKHFTAYLKESPGDLRIRWLLNLAYMTLGEYPDKVPPQFLIPLETFQSKIDVGRFVNVASLAGLTSRGPNQAGGTVFDDFTGDGLPDLFMTSLDIDRGASFYVNRGDGVFEDRSDSAALAQQIYALNVTRADIDNDGNLDLLLLRGGWESPMRLSLLLNKGNGRFEDITVGAGLAEPIATEAAAWGDYDNDGLVDVFVCGEYLPPPSQSTPEPDPRNRCRLYHNQGGGKFVDVAAKAGVLNEQCAKGSAWGDYDGDGRLDLFVSNMGGPCRLYQNKGQGRFVDVAHALGVTGPEHSFACWFWDYDNDGRLDIYVNDYRSSIGEIISAAAGVQSKQPSRPRLYRNVGGLDQFREVTADVGLDRPIAPMGCNFGDIDNDGYLDIYFGTGRMFLEQLVPNVMVKNVSGRHFEDVTMSSGTGHLQKGHGVSFADWDSDGDLDLFVEHGGAVPGDKSYNVLFMNPGHSRHWLKVRLVGTQTNRAAIGAKIHAVVNGPQGMARSIHRTVGNNSSFGGNSLVELIGLMDATSVAELEVTWPTSGATQTFRNVAADQTIEITEGADSFKTLVERRWPHPDADGNAG